jgi:peptidoglycan/xylan/chitin deacetylase (PgdA/CDA1 family)
LTKFFRKRFLLSSLLFLAALFFFRTHYQVPILMYHCIGKAGDSSSSPSGLYVSVENFERQMEFLKVHRYNVVPLATVIEAVKRGERLPTKTVTITFDDGTMDNIDKAFPVLKKMDFPATIFMITSNIDREGWLTREDLRLLDESGVTIGSHTVTHAFLPKITTDAEILTEVRDSKKMLEKILGRPVTLFSYPAGGFTKRSKEIVAEQGYEGAVTTNHGFATDDPFALHRIKIKNSGGSLFNFWIKTSGLYHLGRRRVPVQ